MQTSFPRGGAPNSTSGGSTSVAGKRPRTEDALFGSKGANGGNVKKGRLQQRMEIVQKSPRSGKIHKVVTAEGLPALQTVLGLGTLAATNADVASSKFIEALSYTKLTPGCSVLGYVLQLRADGSVSVSLPGGLIGLVEKHEITDIPFDCSKTDARDDAVTNEYSEEMDHPLRVHQMVRCVVLQPTEQSEQNPKFKRKQQNLRLSMRPSLVQRSITFKHHITSGFPVYGVVFSKEDHGYLLSTGITGGAFFLPHKMVPQSMGILRKGQPVECVCSSIREDSEFVTLRAHPKAVAKATVNNLQFGFAALMPGMLVQCSIEKFVENGLIVKFMGTYYGLVDYCSLARPYSAEEWQQFTSSSKHNKNDVVTVTSSSEDTSEDMRIGSIRSARIVLIDPSNRQVRLSMRPHVLAMTTVSLPALGSLISNLQVKKVLRKSGVLCVSNSGDDDSSKTYSFLSASHLASSVDSNDLDEEDAIEPENIQKVYKADTTIDLARVRGHQLVEGLVIASNRAAYVKGEVVHVSDIRVGQVLTAVVTGIDAVGLLVRLGSQIRPIQAFCPLLHTADVVVENNIKLNKKYKMGQQLKVRIWEKSEKGIIVTNKKTIVDLSDDDTLLPPAAVPPEEVASALCEHVGRVVCGVISSINDQGVNLRFFGRLHGFIPMVVLVKQGVPNPAADFMKGQVLRVVIIGCKNEDKAAFKKKKMLDDTTDSKEINSKIRYPGLYLALHLTKDLSGVLRLIELVPSTERYPPTHQSEYVQSVSKSPSTPADIAIVDTGPDFVSGTIYGFAEDDTAMVRLDDGRSASLHKHQLLNSSALSEELFTRLKANNGTSRIEKALVLCKSKGILRLSCKHLLLSCASTENIASGVDASVPVRLSDLSPGQLVVGYVTKVESYGVMVRFRGMLTALAPRPNLGDRFISDPHETGICRGDAIRCIVQRVDQSTERVIVALKSSMISPATQEINYLTQFFQEQFLVTMLRREESESNGEITSIPNWQNYPIGSIRTAEVSNVEAYGIVLLGDDGVTMMLARDVPTELRQQAEQYLQHKTSDVPGSKKKRGGNKAAVLDRDLTGRFTVRILDVNMESSVMEVSLDPLYAVTTPSTEPIVSKKRKKHAFDESAACNPPSQCSIDADATATVILIKGKYLVVWFKALNKNKASVEGVGFVSLVDFHCPQNPPNQFHKGQQLDVRCVRPSSTNPVEKLSTHDVLNNFPVVSGGPYSCANIFVLREKLSVNKKPSSALKSSNSGKLVIGSMMQWKISAIGEVDLQLTLLQPEQYSGLNLRGRMHISGIIDQDGINDLVADEMDSCEKAESSTKSKKNKNNARGRRDGFASLHVGDVVNCFVQQVKKSSDSDHRKEVLDVLLSIADDPSSLASAADRTLRDFRPPLYLTGDTSALVFSLHAGVVTSIGDQYCTVSISPFASGRLNFADVSEDLRLVQLFAKHCYVGLRVVVMIVDVEKKSGENKFVRIQLSRIPVERVRQYFHKKKGSNLHDITIANTSTESIKAALCSDSEASDDGSEGVADRPYEEGQCINAIVNRHSSADALRPPAFMLQVPQPCIVRSNSNSQRQSVWRRMYVGRLCLTETADVADWIDYSDVFSGSSSGQSAQNLAHGSVLRVRIIHVDEKAHILEVSLRPSRMTTKKLSLALKSDVLPPEGALVPAYVTNPTSRGCFLRLSHAVSGLVQLRYLSDDFVEDPTMLFPVGKLVQARVFKVDPAQMSVLLSLKQSLVQGNVRAQEDIKKLHEGQVVTGTVQRVTEKGVFVVIEGTSLVGLSRAVAALHDKSKSLQEEYAAGDVVRCKVLSVSSLSLKVALGLRPSYFDSDENSTDSDGHDEEEEEIDLNVSEEEDIEMDGSTDDDEGGGMNDDDRILESASASSDEEESQQGSDFDNDASESDDESVNSAPHAGGIFIKQRRNVSAAGGELGALQWGDVRDHSSSFNAQTNKFARMGVLPAEREAESEDEESDEVSDNDGAEGGRKKVRGKQKAAAKRKEERKTLERERALADGSIIPTSADDFERMLIAQPNSSFLWVQYMAFHTQSADVEVARSVASRALRTIDYHLEDEKFNVWIALLNLEYKYGTMSTLETAFARAVAESKGKMIYLTMAGIYEQSGDITGANSLFLAALKRPQYKKSKKVWSAYLSFKLRAGQHDEAKKELSRAMQSLSRHKHVEVISKYAMAEFECGSIDRGRGVFEDLLANYPKRMDLWTLYVDKEVKHGHYQEARQIFKRIIAMKWKTKQMKAVFKKYLAFELANGNAATQDEVREEARNYVNSLA